MINNLFKLYNLNPKTWTNDDEQLYTILHFAARYDRIDVLEYGLFNGCNVNSLTCMESNPLHYMNINNNEIRNILINSGCDVHKINKIGNIAINGTGNINSVPDSFKENFFKVLQNY